MAASERPYQPRRPRARRRTALRVLRTRLRSVPPRQRHALGGGRRARDGGAGLAALAWRRASPRTVWPITTAASTWLLVTRHGPDWGGLSPLVLIPAPLVALYGLTSDGVASQAGKLQSQAAAVLTLFALEPACCRTWPGRRRSS